MDYMRRSATEAQLGLEFGGVSKMESEFGFLLQSGLKFTFELEFEFEFDFEFKSELALEVAPELEFELASSSIHLPAFLPSVKETTATREKTDAELNFHVNFVRELPFRDPKLVSKRPSGRPEWNTSGNLRPRN